MNKRFVATWICFGDDRHMQMNQDFVRGLLAIVKRHNKTSFAKLPTACDVWWPGFNESACVCK